MMRDISADSVRRRSLVKGSVWAIPAVAVAQAAPAIAASCVPRSESKATAVHWTSTQTSFTGSDVETHVVAYTFDNAGPDALPAGAEARVHLSYDTLDDPDTDQTSVAITSGAVSGRVIVADPVDNGDGTFHREFDVVVTVDQPIGAKDSFTFDVTAMYGAITAPPTESIATNSPYTYTTVDGCVTTTTVISIDGASDGTSYQS